MAESGCHTDVLLQCEGRYWLPTQRGQRSWLLSWTVLAS